MAFTPRAIDITDYTQFPTDPPSEDDIRQDLEDAFQEVYDNVTNPLLAVADGASGMDLVGMTPIDGVMTTPQQALEYLKGRVDQSAPILKTVSVLDFGADPTGLTDSTSAIQNAFTYASTLYGGDTSTITGYIGFYLPEVVFPTGEYLCGQITTNTKLKIKAQGQVVIKSLTGTSSVFSGKFIDNAVTNFEVEGIGFLYFDTVFTIPTGNVDFSFITFKKCKFAKCNLLIDTVSFASSRSTTFKMERCLVTYDVEKIAKIYTDKAIFEKNWFMHTKDSILFEIDSFCSFKDNVWVPLTGSVNKAYISFSTTDSVRSLIFDNERFGGESGACPIVIVGDVNINNTNDAYRQQGITFKNCYMSSNSTYDPDTTTGVRACVVLRPTLEPNKSINYINFIGCSFLPDLSGGIVQTYDPITIRDYMKDDFVISFDYASIISATKGVNKPCSENLLPYLNSETIYKKIYSQAKGTGKVTAIDTATTGIKKATFKFNRTWPSSFHTVGTFLVTLIGQGDSSFSNLAFGYSSVYILTISGENAATTRSKISYTKLHGSVGGVSLGAKADIVSAHWGTADTGSSEELITGSVTEFDITITFGTRMQLGYAYIKPLNDFSLLS